MKVEIELPYKKMTQFIEILELKLMSNMSQQHNIIEEISHCLYYEKTQMCDNCSERYTNCPLYKEIQEIKQEEELLNQILNQIKS